MSEIGAYGVSATSFLDELGGLPDEGPSDAAAEQPRSGHRPLSTSVKRAMRVFLRLLAFPIAHVRPAGPYALAPWPARPKLGQRGSDTTHDGSDAPVPSSVPPSTHLHTSP